MKSKTGIIRIIVVCILLLAAVSAGLVLRGLHMLPYFGIEYEEQVLALSEEYDLDPCFVFAVIRSESSFRTDAHSWAGAVGLMQIMPSTGMWIAEKREIPDFSEEDLWNEETNLDFGCWYLRFLLDLFDQDERLAAAAYNAGQGNVKKWLSDPELSPDGELQKVPYHETDVYLKRVLFFREAFRLLYPDVVSVTR